MAARIAVVQNSGVAKAASAPRVTKSRRLIRSMGMVMETAISPDGCQTKARCYTLERSSSKILLGFYRDLPLGLRYT
jgi:hypothetical protein